MKKLLNDYLVRGSIGFILAIIPGTWWVNGMTESLVGPVVSILLLAGLVVSIIGKWKFK